ncbi:MAG: tRNA guanosine(34) transglycosylase Tgt [Planctomycetes bacterium]|jgi:queuine tRNA-ribosyltransferase|nr:tRNA guanosine(34) transglycosylase Tgt [Planctomycetota bacterium]
MFKLLETKNKIRRGRIITGHGVLETPFFMPDATRGFVKLSTQEEVRKSGVLAMVVNTLHLYLQPGMEIIKKGKGVHKFMNWDQPLLSDSGGFQVFSLIHQNKNMGKIYDDKVVFKSPLDGSYHELTPEKSIQIQFDLGVDMMVCLDDCPPNELSREDLQKAVVRTIAWAKRCKDEYLRQVKKRKLTGKNKPLLFGVIQGGAELDLREHCAQELVKIGFDGYGFGAKHLDSDDNFLETVLAKTASFIPQDSLRFALGVGSPKDIVRAAKLGWDMFDCVMPTREGRHGKLFYFKGEDKIKKLSAENLKGTSEKNNINRKKNNLNKDFYNSINISNARFNNDFSPINAKSKFIELRHYNKAFLHHLFKLKEPLGQRLASLNNLEFYQELMKML